ncbi:hypothetical protein [Aquimarina latercula]|uniref:hypothetical protein n=1 Tax=Aquimarina latercula TaxID=987 RepID=UPI0012DFD8AD|nr:hypothetical protein [Aquimarina latercula]
MYRSVKDTNITLLFHKAIKVPKIKSFNDLYENVWEEKINKSKESIDFIIENTFDTNKWLLSRKYILNGNDFFLENEKYDIDTLSYHGYKFLIQEGKKYLRIYQLTKLTEKELSFISNDSFYSYQKRLISTRRNKRGIDSDSSFSICNEHQIGEYYYGNRGTRYKGGKRFLSEYFLEKYSSPIDSSQNGYVRIRFVVNCNGKTGRYSIQETDVHFKEVKFNPEIVSQLFLLTKDLKEWIPNSSYRKEVIDTYKHLTFKIKNGQIKEILP